MWWWTHRQSSSSCWEIMPMRLTREPMISGSRRHQLSDEGTSMSSFFWRKAERFIRGLGAYIISSLKCNRAKVEHNFRFQISKPVTFHFYSWLQFQSGPRPPRQALNEPEASIYYQWLPYLESKRITMHIGISVMCIIFSDCCCRSRWKRMALA